MNRLDELTKKLKDFVTERDWHQYHDPKNLVMLLASEVGELVAELRWIPNDVSDKELEGGEKRLRVEQEIGDVFISLVMLADRIGLDLVDTAEKKLSLNQKKYPASEYYGKSEK